MTYDAPFAVDAISEFSKPACIGHLDIDGVHVSCVIVGHHAACAGLAPIVS